MIVSLVKAEEAEKTSNQSNCDVESVTRAALCTLYAMYHLQVLHKKEEKEKLRYSSWVTQPFFPLKDRINEVKVNNSPASESAIIKFCSLITENDLLYRELRILNDLAKNSTNKEFNFQLERIITDFELKNLENKMGFLVLLKKESNFTAIQKAYRDKWALLNLINDKDFKQMYIDKAIDELGSEGLRESVNKYIRLSEQGKKVANKHFGGEGVELQAYYTEDDNSHRVLNINCINEDKELRISDVLQQEKDVDKLNIYCNKKLRVSAYRKDKERHYEFKEGAYYGMESTWRAPCEGGGFVVCTIVINVSSDGIAEILEFKIDGKNRKIPDEWVESNDENGGQSQEQLAIDQNDELRIQGFTLIKAIKDYQKREQEKIWPSDLSLMNKTKKEGDISSNIEHIDAIEKVAESRNLSFPH